MGIQTKLAKWFWMRLERHNHDHILRYKEIKIGDSIDFTTRPYKVMYEEFAPGKYGIWYEECQI